VRVKEALERTKQGVNWLLIHWYGLCDVLESNDTWDERQGRLASDLLGTPSSSARAAASSRPRPRHWPRWLRARWTAGKEDWRRGCSPWMRPSGGWPRSGRPWKRTRTLSACGSSRPAPARNTGGPGRAPRVPGRHDRHQGGPPPPQAGDRCGDIVPSPRPGRPSPPQPASSWCRDCKWLAASSPACRSRPAHGDPREGTDRGFSQACRYTGTRSFLAPELVVGVPDDRVNATTRKTSIDRSGRGGAGPGRVYRSVDICRPIGRLLRDMSQAARAGKLRPGPESMTAQDFRKMIASEDFQPSLSRRTRDENMLISDPSTLWLPGGYESTVVLAIPGKGITLLDITAIETVQFEAAP